MSGIRLRLVSTLLAHSKRGRLTRVRNLEENILHDIAAIWSLKFELVSVEVDVVETPGWRTENSCHASLTLHDLETEIDGVFTCVACCPTLPAHGVGAVSICSHALAIDPCLRNGVSCLSLGKSQHLAHHRCGCNLDKYNVIQADFVEGVLQSQAALDLVCLDHGLEDILDGKDLATSDLASCSVRSAHPVCDRKNSSEVVTGVTPFGSKPAVVKVEPPDHGANVESSEHRVKLIRGTRDTSAMWYSGAFDDRTQ